MKTAATFVTIDGVRYSLPGDRAEIDADGTIRLLGRGALCINTGGEKVYPEEVEAVLKTHPDVADAVVVGVPDDRWGQRVAAVIELSDGAEAPTLADVQDHCRASLAGYKVPRSLTVVDAVPRSPAGKADYLWAAQVGASAMTTLDEQLDEVGYAVVPDVLTTDEIASVRDALAPHLADGPRGRNPFEGHETQRVYCLVAKSRAFDRLILDPLMLEIAERALGANFLLTATLAIDLHPGETAQDFHSDDGFYRIPRPRPPVSVSTMWAIDDFTNDNGATLIYPGSHRWGDERPSHLPPGADRGDDRRIGARVRGNARARGRGEPVGRVPPRHLDPVLRGVGPPAGELHARARCRGCPRPADEIAGADRVQHPPSVHGDDRRPPSEEAARPVDLTRNRHRLGASMSRRWETVRGCCTARSDPPPWRCGTPRHLQPPRRKS